MTNMTQQLEQAYEAFLAAHGPIDGKFTQDTFREGIATSVSTLLRIDPFARIEWGLAFPDQIRETPVEEVVTYGNRIEHYFSERLGEKAEIIQKNWSQNQY